MFSDPLGITYNAVAKSLPRASRSQPGIRKVLGHASYQTNDGEFYANTTRSLMSDGYLKSEITLGRQVPDTTEPITSYRNEFGFVYYMNPTLYVSTVDIGRLRTALSTLVDASFEARIIGGEL
jgi:hypothetical protein